MPHILILNTGFLLNLETDEYLRDGHGRAINIPGSLSDAAAYVENEVGGTWETE